MKNTILILFLLYFLTGCKDKKLTHQETVTKYYGARDTDDYHELKALVYDSITHIAEPQIMRYDKSSFYENFKWDSVFRPSYEVFELQEKDNQIVATVAQNNLRNAFLKNNPLVFQVEISFTDGKISKIKELDYVGVDWNVWNK